MNSETEHQSRQDPTNDAHRIVLALVADPAHDMIAMCAGHDRVRLGDLADGQPLDPPHDKLQHNSGVHATTAVAWLTDLCAWLTGEQPNDPRQVETWVAQRLGPCTTKAERVVECTMIVHAKHTRSALVARMRAAR